MEHHLSNGETIRGSGYGLTLEGAFNGTIDSAIGTGTGTLPFRSGTWTLAGTNTYTGANN